MMINGVNSINQVNNVQNLHKTERASRAVDNSDSISVSDEAKEVYLLQKAAAETPDVRADRIAEVREKIKDPSYLSDAVIKSAADKFLSAIGL